MVAFASELTLAGTSEFWDVSPSQLDLLGLAPTSPAQVSGVPSKCGTSGKTTAAEASLVLREF